MKRGNIPQRTCLVCRRKNVKTELLRFVYRQDGILEDVAQVMTGRGVYCCVNSTCRERLDKKRKVLKRAFRIQD